jgi:SagB-type dehydrogenase family enzyme
MKTNRNQINLPGPSFKGKISLEEALYNRRSVREFSNAPLSLLQVSQLLWACQGISDDYSMLRTAASAGATFPLEVFIVIGTDCVTSLDRGIYYYDRNIHSLILSYNLDVKKELATAALNQDFIEQAPLSIIICAEYQRTTARYDTRGVRYVHMEAGHACQNVYLEAVALGLGTVAVGAFNDEQVSRVLKLKENIEPLYIMPVGELA